MCLCDLASDSHEDVIFLVIDSLQIVVRVSSINKLQLLYVVIVYVDDVVTACRWTCHRPHDVCLRWFPWQRRSSYSILMVGLCMSVRMCTCVCSPCCTDPGISSCVQELFEALSVNPGCHASLHAHVLPIATDILTSSSAHLPLGLVAVRECGREGGGRAVRRGGEGGKEQNK